jgi:hypothetical protein
MATLSSRRQMFVGAENAAAIAAIAIAQFIASWLLCRFPVGPIEPMRGWSIRVSSCATLSNSAEEAMHLSEIGKL